MMINPIYKFEINRPTINLLDPDTLMVGYALNTSTGATSKNTSYTTSAFIVVSGGETYKCLQWDDSSGSITSWVYYDKNKSRLSSTSNASSSTAPQNAAYLRVTFPVAWEALDYGVFPSSVNEFSDHVSPEVSPVWKDDLAKEFVTENEGQFFREKLNGDLVFVRNDFDFINEAEFEFEFKLILNISYDNGLTWEPYWRGHFWKTDCEFDLDDKKVTVAPESDDQYSAILAGMEKEFDLINLAPQIRSVKMDERPLVQVYIPGESVISCFLAGMYWEQDCNVEDDENKLIQTGDGKYNFAKVSGIRTAIITNRTDLVGGFFGEAQPVITGYTYTSGAYKLTYSYDMVAGGVKQTWTILQGTTPKWSYEEVTNNPSMPPYNLTLTPVAGSGASGNVILSFNDTNVYARYLCDVPYVRDQPTSRLPDEDITERNKNYNYVIAYALTDTVHVSNNFSATPTKWGIRQPGEYYLPPYSIYGREFFPIARTTWNYYSIWFTFSMFDSTIEPYARHPITLREAYPLHSVISVLLGQIDPSVEHDGTTDYSQFLYGLNPITGVNLTYLITPKSNLVVSEYDQPAQKAPITLAQVLDMLRDCFRCYWFVEDGKFRIEHISYFMNGGSYGDGPTVGRDLTVEQVRRTGKKWAFGTSKYSYEKADMAARYQFGWMDEGTELFDGIPIDIISKYVDAGSIMDIKVSSFTSDVDYMMLEPQDISKDGFALLGASYPAEENLVTTVENNQALVIDGSTAVLSGYSVCDYIPVSGYDIKADGSTPFGSAIYVKYCVYDENHTFLRYGNDDIYYYRPGDAFVRFTFDTGSARAFNYSLVLPYYNHVIGTNDHILQNGFVAFCFLQNYYAYDMPAWTYKIGDDTLTAFGIKRQKVQELTFPCYHDPDMVKLVKTYLGEGKIGKISITLSSRSAKATLKYDTE